MAVVLSFDENAYLGNNLDVQQAVQDPGSSLSALEHYRLFGQFEGRDAYLTDGTDTITFVTTDYSSTWTDVAGAVASGAVQSHVDHFLDFGLNEGRTFNTSLFNGTFDETTYLTDNTDVDEAVQAGAFQSGYEHWLAFGSAEGRAAQTTDGEVITGGSVPGVATLTVEPDNLTANRFDAPRVFDPEGDDQTNSLQDDDVLTGTGDNPTLDFTYVNDVDTNDYDIVPTLNNIATINVEFATDGDPATGARLDVQDSSGLSNAVNVSRMDDDLAVAEIVNMGQDGIAPTDLSISSSNAIATQVNFTFLPAAVSADDQSINLALSNAQVAGVRIEEELAQAGLGFETINITSSTNTNTIGQLTAEDLEVLTIAGDQAFNLRTEVNTVGDQGVEATRYGGGLANTGGSLSTVDASALTADLALTLGAELVAGQDGTSGVAQNVAVTGGSGNDTFYLNATTVETGDSIDGGDGTNTVVLLSGATIAGTVSNVQGAEIRSGHDAGAAADAVTIDASVVPELETILVRNEGQDLVGTQWTSAAEGLTANLNNLTAAQATAITVLHGTTGNNGLANNVVNVTFATDTDNDTVGVTLADGVNADPSFDVQLNAATAENVTITDNDTESNTVQLGGVAGHTGTITVTGGEAGDVFNLDATGAERIGAATVDASGYVGDMVVRLGTNANSTDGAQSVTTGTGDDQVIFDVIDANEDTSGTAGLTGADTVNAGAGTDTLVLDGDGQDIIVQQSEWDNLSNFENLRLAGNGAGNIYRLQLDNDFIAANNDGSALNIINDDGSAVSTTDNVDAADINNAAVIFADQLSANNHFTYDGEEGSGATADRFVVNDANTNGGNAIDGGNVDVIDADGDGDDDTAVASADVLEVRNTATVTTSDLAQVQNVGTIVINNTEAVQQTLNLTLNSTVVDALVDSGHTATTDEVETLTIIANDGQATDEAGNPLVPLAAAAINLDARNVGGQFALDIRGDAMGGNDVVDLTVRYGGGQHVIDLAGGTDQVTIRGLDPNGGVARQGDVFTFTNTEGQEVEYTISNVADEGITLLDEDDNSVAVPSDISPVANADTAAVDENATVGIDVLANDTDPQNDALSVTAINGTAVAAGDTVATGNGANVTLNVDGTLTYDPTVAAFADLDEGVTLDDTFTYTVSDGANTDVGNVTVTVTGINEAAVTVVDLSADDDGIVDAVAGTAEAFLLDFDSTDGTIAVSDDAVVTINGFDPTEDILRFDDAQATPISEADFLNAALVAENGFDNETTISFSDPDGTDAVEPAVITLTGIVDDTLGGADPFFEVV